MNSEQKSIKVNGIMNMILTISSFVFPLITFPYASRILKPTGMGKVSFAISLIAYFSMFAQLGIPTYGIRACAKVRDNKEELTRVTHELLAINLITNVISYIGLIIAVLLVKRLNEDRLLIFIVSSTILLTSIGVEWLYKGLEQYTYITIRSIIFKIISLAGLFLLIHNEDDYVIYGAISIFASSASNVLNFINIRKFVFLKKVGNYNLKRHLKAVGVFLAMACATTIYTNLDIVMLGFMKTNADVGYYNAAVKVKSILVGIVTSIGAVLLPRSSYYIEQGRRGEFLNVSNKALKFVLFASIPTVVYFIIYAMQGILLLSGSAYAPAVIPMQVIMPTVLLIGITNIFGIQMLVPMGKEKYVLYSEIVGAVLDLILNAILIPLYGATGAAIGTLVAEVGVLVYQIYAVRQEIINFTVKKSIARYMVATCIATMTCLWVKRLQLTNFTTLFLSGLTFFGVYIMCLFFMKDEMVNISAWKRE